MVDRSRALIGILLIAGGVIFLLDAADVIPARNILSNWWPLILIGFGLYVMFGRPRSWTGGAILIAIGAILLLATLDAIDVSFWQLIIPLVLIGAGLGLLIRGVRGGGTSDRSARLNLVGVLSEQDVRSESDEFYQASLSSILGEVTLDLRNATLAPRGAAVDIFCMLGDVTVIVPRGWRIQLDGTPILADVEDGTDHEQDLPPDAPEIAISGVAILGDVSIKHG